MKASRQLLRPPHSHTHKNTTPGAAARGPPGTLQSSDGQPEIDGEFGCVVGVAPTGKKGAASRVNVKVGHGKKNPNDVRSRPKRT